MELKTQELVRKIAYLQMEKATVDNERADLIHNINLYSTDIDAIKTNMDNKIATYESSNQ
jgi:hypothetical protein